MAVANDTAGRGRGYPVRTRTIEMVEVGAGGGSVAALDPGGALGVGPESAGADPGPACYGQGGDRPTITDANLVLGRLNPDYFLAGAKKLGRDRSVEVIRTQIAEPMGYDLASAAHAIIEIANARMAAAMEMMSIRRGVDPRDYVMVACGGGGPLHAAAIARRIGMKQVLIPPMPGLTAALGLVSTDLKHEFTRNIMRRPDEMKGPELSSDLADLVAAGRKVLLSENVTEDAMEFQYLVDIGYLGQSFPLRIDLPSADITETVLTELVERFHVRHKDTYGFSSPEERTMIVSLRVIATGRIARPKIEPVETGGSDGSAAKKGERMVHLSGDSPEPVSCTIYERSLLRLGDVFSGPAIIEQMDTTTLVPEGASVELDELGNLLITV